MIEKQPATGVFAPLYYIQNRLPVGNCVSWWAEGGHGYTCDLDRAGKYSEEEAANIVRNRPDIDKAWRCEDVDGAVSRHVDSQRLKEFRALQAGTEHLRRTAQEAVDKLASDKKRAANCTHEHLDMDGICHRCGADRRGI